jgi:hypothetical protein
MGATAKGCFLEDAYTTTPDSRIWDFSPMRLGSRKDTRESTKSPDDHCPDKTHTAVAGSTPSPGGFISRKGTLQETTSVARWKMRVSSVASFIRCLSANSARYRSVNCMLDSAAILCGEKSSGINRQRCFRTNSARAFRQGCGSARNGNVSPLLIRKKPNSLIGQVAVCLPCSQASTLGWS